VAFSLDVLNANIVEWSRSEEAMFVSGKAATLVPFSDFGSLGLSTFAKLKTLAAQETVKYDDKQLHEILQNRIKNIKKSMSTLVNKPEVYLALEERLVNHKHQNNENVKERRLPQEIPLMKQFSFQKIRKQKVIRFLNNCQEYFLKDPFSGYSLRQGLGRQGKTLLNQFRHDEEESFEEARIRFSTCLKNISNCEKNKHVWYHRLQIEQNREQMPEDVEDVGDDDDHDDDDDDDEGNEGDNEYGVNQGGRNSDDDGGEGDVHSEQQYGGEGDGRGEKNNRSISLSGTSSDSSSNSSISESEESSSDSSSDSSSSASEESSNLGNSSKSSKRKARLSNDSRDSLESEESSSDSSFDSSSSASEESSSDYSSDYSSSPDNAGSVITASQINYQDEASTGGFPREASIQTQPASSSRRSSKRSKRSVS
jgi:hypothetical protein